MANPIATLGIFPSLILFFFYLFIQTSSATRFNVISFGAKPDGRTNSMQPFLKAWISACSSLTASIINVPKERFLLTPIIFRGPCKNKITFRMDGTLVAPLDYLALGNSGYWILFIKVDGVSIVGGHIDANGIGYWDCKKSGKNCPVGASVK